MKIDLPRVDLIQRPTPIHRLPRLSEELGVDLWIKRDDLTGFAFGGNKGRKLEFLIAQALAERAEVVVTCGSAQSNFVRQLGAACACFGLRCVAATMYLPHEPEMGKPEEAFAHDRSGNLFLDDLVGVVVRIFPDDSWNKLFEHAEDLAVAEEHAGRRVYRVPVGGSSPLGAYSFVEAASELQPFPAFDTLVSPSSSGSTLAGLAYALHGTSTRVVGISCDPEPENLDDLVRLTAGLDALLGLSKRMDRASFDLRFDFVGPGYGVPSSAGDAATTRLARREGLFLDPVYSAKAFAGLLALFEAGDIGGRILFWHTGGLPALLANRA